MVVIVISIQELCIFYADPRASRGQRQDFVGGDPL